MERAEVDEEGTPGGGGERSERHASLISISDL